MTASSKLRKIYEDEKKAQADRKKAKKAEREAKGPLVIRAGQFIKRWTVRLFHTLFFVVFVYVFVMSCVSLIPAALGYIVGSFGYTLESAAEIILASLSGLFFTAWVFAVSFFIVKKVFGIYSKNIKKTIPEQSEEQTDDSKK